MRVPLRWWYFEINVKQNTCFVVVELTVVDGGRCSGGCGMVGVVVAVMWPV